MGQIRVPPFIRKIEKQEDREAMMKQYASWKRWAVAEEFVKYLEKEIERLVLEDEQDEPESEFQHKWSRVKRLGKRELLRKIIKDLK